MGNKLNTRRRSYSDTDDHDTGKRRRTKPKRSQSASQIDGRSNRISLPSDVGGAVPYKPRKEEPEVDVKLYRSFGDLARPKSETLDQQDIRIYRRSTDGLNKYASLPRHFGRSKSTTGVPNGTVRDYPEMGSRSSDTPDYPEIMRRKRSPPDSESSSIRDRESQRTSKRVSAASSVSSLARAPVSMEDFPTTAQIRRKLKVFEDQFCRSLADKYAGLADTLQLSALAIALNRGQDGLYRQVSLLDYLDNELVPADILERGEPEYIMLIPEALFHGIMHVRNDKISDLELWTNLARDLVTCIGVEAANELSRMFEYQIALLTGDSAVRVLADHAAACVIEYIKKHNAYLDRNTATLGALRGNPSVALTGAPKYLSVILGNRELKWGVQDVLRCPGLKKEMFLFSDSLDEPDSLYSPYLYYTNTDSNPQLYGYRGLLLEWDWIRKVYAVNAEDEARYAEDINDPISYPDDFHRLYSPYKRLFGTDVMIKYCTSKSENKTGDTLAQYLSDSTGDSTNRDEIQPVYRPLSTPKKPLNFGTSNLDNVDLTRAQLRSADLSQASVRNAKLLLTDVQGATLSRMDGTATGQLQGTDVSYTSLTESTMDQATLDGMTARHVVVMRPKKVKKRAKSAPVRAQDDQPTTQSEVPNGHDDPQAQVVDQATPVTTKPKKKKKKVPRTLDIEINASGDVVDGDVVQTNGHVQNPDEPEELIEEQEIGPEETETQIRSSYISDSQGNLLEIDQAESKGVKKVKKVKRSKKSGSDPKIIEQKQKKIRERKKKIKKRPVSPVASTPTETIPETPVFIEESPLQSVQQQGYQQPPPPPQHPPPYEVDQTQQFFTDSQPYQEPAPVLSNVVVIEKLQEEPGSRRVRRTDVNGSEGGHSVTDYNVLDVTQSSEITQPDEVTQSVDPESKGKKPRKKSKDKTKDKEKSKDKEKTGDKKRKKSKSQTPEKELGSPALSERAAPPLEDLLKVSPADSVHSAPEVIVTADPVDKKKKKKKKSSSSAPPKEEELSLSQKSPGKSLSATDIHHQHSLSSFPAQAPSSRRDIGLYPRMTKSLSHHGTLSGGGKAHNLSLDSYGLGLRTARQIYGMSKEEIEFITRSQIFNMIQGLQVENLDSNLPDVDKQFFGRESERDDVTEMLSSSGHIVTITSCYGNGKSALATAVGHEIRKKFVVPMLIDVRGCVSAASVAYRMVHTFGLHFRMKEMNLFYNWLNCHEQRLLFVIDNLDMAVEEDNRFSDLLDDMMNNVKNMRILCTSRRNFYRGDSPHEVYRLGNLRNCSIDMLKSSLPDLHDEGIEILLDGCCHNPLVMNLMSKAFLMEEVDSGKLFEELADTLNHSLLDRVEAAATYITDDEGEMEILAKLACCILKILDNIPLGHSELLTCASYYAYSFDAKSLGEFAERQDIKDVEASLEELIGTGLVLKVGDRYALPNLVKFVCQSKSPGGGSDTLEHFLKTIESMKLVCTQYHSKQCHEAVTTFNNNLDNYISVLNQLIQREDTYEYFQSLASLEYALFLSENLPDEVYVDLYESFAAQAEEQGDVAKQCRSLCCLAHKHIMDENIPLAKQAADSAYSLVHSNGSAITESERAFCLRCLGKIAWEEHEDRARAVLLVKKALDLYKSSQGSRDLQTIYTNELYSWMMTRKESFQTARHFYNISDLFVKDMMDEHPLLVEGYDCRRTIWDKLCLFQRAIDMAKKAVEVSKKFYGEHPITAKMITHLCEAIIKRGSLNDAISTGIEALAIRSKVLGDHVDTGQSYKTLAYLMLRSGQYDEASRFGQSALDIYDKVNAKEQLKIDAKNVITQARVRLEYKSHVFIEIPAREANKKNLQNGGEDLNVSRASSRVPSVSTEV